MPRRAHGSKQFVAQEEEQVAQEESGKISFRSRFLRDHPFPPNFLKLFVVQGRKSDSSLEGVNANHSAGSDGSSSNQQRSPRKMGGNRAMRTISRDCHGRLTTLVKSGSFSGCTAHQQLSAERTIVSDPTPPFRLPCCTSVASVSETEGEEQRNRARGCFPFDDNLFDTVLNKELCNQQLNMDSDIEMNSLGNNSFSEQAWDNYQVIGYDTLCSFIFLACVCVFFFQEDIFVPWRRRSCFRKLIFSRIDSRLRYRDVALPVSDDLFLIM